MPQVRQYESQAPTPGPMQVQRATGEDFGSDIGVQGQVFGQNVQKFGEVIHQQQTMDDISNLNANLADTHNNLELQYKDQLQKGTLNHDDFMENVNNQMDALGQTVNTSSGQRRFNQLQAQTKLYFSQQAQAGEAHLAGEKAVQNYKLFADKTSSSLENNPAGFQNALQTKDSFIDDLVANKSLPATEGEKLKTEAMTEFAKSAVRGVLRVDPQGGRQQLVNGDWDQYMNGDVKYKMLQEATMFEHGQMIDQQRQQKVLQDAADARQEAAKEDMLQKLYGNGLSTRDVLQNNNLDEAAKEHMLSLVEKRQTEKVSTDNPAMRNLFANILLPEGDPKKFIHSQDDLNRFYVKGQINTEGLKILRGEFVNKGTVQGDADNQLAKNFTEMAFNQIAKPDPVTKLPDPQGQLNYQTWLADMLQRKQTAMANGQKASDLFDPKSPNYLGNNISQYQRTPEQIMQDMVKGRSQPGQSTEPMVDVVDPSGRPGKIPQSKVEAAKARGFKVK